jgi:hypothetical protein
MSTTKQDNKKRKSDNNDDSNSEEPGKSPKTVIRAKAREKFHKTFLSQATLVIVGVGNPQCLFSHQSYLSEHLKQFPPPTEEEEPPRLDFTYSTTPIEQMKEDSTTPLLNLSAYDNTIILPGNYFFASQGMDSIKVYHLFSRLTLSEGTMFFPALTLAYYTMYSKNNVDELLEEHKLPAVKLIQPET